MAKEDYLDNATQRALRAFSCMGSEPRSVSPNSLAIAAGDDLVAADDQLKRPHSRQHLPKNKAPAFPTSSPQALHIFSGRNLRLTTDHLHCSCCVHIFCTLLLFQATRGRQVLLYDIMCTRSFLPKSQLHKSS